MRTDTQHPQRSPPHPWCVAAMVQLEHPRQPWYNWNIRVTFHIWVGSIFDPGNPYEVDTFDGVMLPRSGMNRSGGFLYAWLTNQDGTDELVVMAHVHTFFGSVWPCCAASGCHCPSHQSGVAVAMTLTSMATTGARAPQPALWRRQPRRWKPPWPGAAEKREAE